MRGMVAANRAVLGQLECPLDRQRDGRCETHGTEELRGSALLAANTVDAFCVTHLCRELQIRAGEDRRQRTRENCVDSKSHPVGSAQAPTGASRSLCSRRMAMRGGYRRRWIRPGEATC
jgi:hypothetical protein